MKTKPIGLKTHYFNNREPPLQKNTAQNFNNLLKPLNNEKK